MIVDRIHHVVGEPHRCGMGVQARFARAICARHTLRSMVGALLTGTLLAAATPTLSQEPTERFTDPFPSSRWCEDSGTACWWDPADRDWFNGVRLIADFDVRFLFQRGGNRFVHSGFLSLPKLAFEVNIYRSWVAFQVAIRGPGEIQVDELSPIRSVMKDPVGIIPSDIGLSAGFSFLDSSVAVLLGSMEYDRRHFNVGFCDSPEAIEAEKRQRRTSSSPQAQCLLHGDVRDTYAYLTFQPLSAIRSGIKQGEKADEEGDKTAPAGSSSVPPRAP